MQYDPYAAVAYAHQWAYARNPKFYSFDKVGGDCTSFVSQCLLAGNAVMNYTRDLGWYYRSANNRSPAWSGVEYLYRFLLRNQSAGPYAAEWPLEDAQMGDIIQLSFDGIAYTHSLIVVAANNEILISTHSIDSDNRPLSTYSYQAIRLLHIYGIRARNIR